jgi:hypothetical protein
MLMATAVAAAVITEAASATTSHSLMTGVYPVVERSPADDTVALARIKATGARFVRLDLIWRAVAPAVRPAGFQAGDPADPAYNWTEVDARIRRIHDAGLEPLVSIVLAPRWAERAPPLLGWPGVANPDPAALGLFARAAALRYSDGFDGLPRVRYWSAWNEPNLTIFFYPQLDATGPVSPEWYREAVNTFASAVHGVHADNVVIAGETAPFRDITPEAMAFDKDWGPLKFMRRLLCLDDAGRPTCDKAVAFDVWSTHPYTSGGPTHHAALPYDISLGDLAKMRATLDAAIRAHHIKSAEAVQFWATEFSWDSNPPDRCSPPISLLKRWVPEALYRMWANGIDEVTWFQLMDLPMSVSPFQSGLYWYAKTVSAAKPKPFLQGFRFPFVALRRGGGVYVWARTPFGKPGPLTIEQQSGHGWKPLERLRADRFGIAQAMLKVRPVGQFRVTTANGDRSLSFSMRVPPDHFYNPFGLPGLLEPNGQPCKG